MRSPLLRTVLYSDGKGGKRVGPIHPPATQRRLRKWSRAAASAHRAHMPMAPSIIVQLKRAHVIKNFYCIQRLCNKAFHYVNELNAPDVFAPEDALFKHSCLATFIGVMVYLFVCLIISWFGRRVRQCCFRHLDNQ
jgi:hypothetical protein